MHTRKSCLTHTDDYKRKAAVRELELDAAWKEQLGVERKAVEQVRSSPSFQPQEELTPIV